MRFAKHFWTTVLSLSGLVGLYLAAVAGKLVWSFWAVVAASVLVAGSIVFVPKLLDWANRAKKYESLLRSVAVAKDENANLKQELREAQAKIESRWSDGREEGIRRVIGCLMAQSAEVPTLTGIGIEEGEAVVLFARWTPRCAPIGARYALLAKATGVTRGEVEVRDIDASRAVMTLVCVEATIARFWEALADDAEVHDAAPHDVYLSPAVEPALLPIQKPEEDAEPILTLEAEV